MKLFKFSYFNSKICLLVKKDINIVFIIIKFQDFPNNLDIEQASLDLNIIISSITNFNLEDKIYASNFFLNNLSINFESRPCQLEKDFELSLSKSVYHFHDKYFFCNIKWISNIMNKYHLIENAKLWNKLNYIFVYYIDKELYYRVPELKIQEKQLIENFSNNIGDINVNKNSSFLFDEYFKNGLNTYQIYHIDVKNGCVNKDKITMQNKDQICDVFNNCSPIIDLNNSKKKNNIKISDLKIKDNTDKSMVIGGKYLLRDRKRCNSDSSGGYSIIILDNISPIKPVRSDSKNINIQNHKYLNTNTTSNITNIVNDDNERNILKGNITESNVQRFNDDFYKESIDMFSENLDDNLNSTAERLIDSGLCVSSNEEGYNINAWVDDVYKRFQQNYKKRSTHDNNDVAQVRKRSCLKTNYRDQSLFGQDKENSAMHDDSSIIEWVLKEEKYEMMRLQNL